MRKDASKRLIQSTIECNYMQPKISSFENHRAVAILRMHEILYQFSHRMVCMKIRMIRSLRIDQHLFVVQ